MCFRRNRGGRAERAEPDQASDAVCGRPILRGPRDGTGDTLLLLIDTGGGGMWMVKPALERLGFNPQPLGVVLHDTAFTGGRFPIFDETASIPAPLDTPNPW